MKKGKISMEMVRHGNGSYDGETLGVLWCLGTDHALAHGKRELADLVKEKDDGEGLNQKDLHRLGRPLAQVP